MDMLGKAVVLAFVMMAAVPAGARPAATAWVEEEVNPAEVVLREGQAWYYGRDGYERLGVRSRDGGTIYFRKAPAYDPEYGYAQAEAGDAAVAPADGAWPASPAVVPGFAGGGAAKYYGNGRYGPDHFRSPYNRDARQVRYGPGYYQSCSRYDGCRGLWAVPSAARGPQVVLVPVPE